MVFSAVDSAFSCWVLDFGLGSLEVGVYLLGLVFCVLAWVEHHCKVKVKRKTRELVEVGINKLEYFHVANVELLRYKQGTRMMHFLYNSFVCLHFFRVAADSQIFIVAFDLIRRNDDLLVISSESKYFVPFSVNF